MKPLILCLFLFLLLFSCQKEVKQNDPQNFSAHIQISLRDCISAADYASLDLSKIFLTQPDSDKVFLVRIPIKGKLLRTDFVLVQTDAMGSVLKGKIIHIDGEDENYQFNGEISISSLDRNHTVTSSIEQGYIRAFHPLARTEVLPGYVELPEVIVVGHIGSNGISYSDYLSLMSLFNTISYASFYTSLDGSPGGGSGSGGGGGGSSGSPDNTGITVSPTIQADYDTYVNHDAIDITKYLKCFGSIPDAGATCSITIYSDIPVNGDPSQFFNWQSGSPGHTFISFRKSNGQQSVQQVFGWYPAQSWQAVTTTAPINGKFVDDAGHEFNASYTVNINTLELQTGITKVLSLARTITYDIDEYNCTDFALEVFNSTVYPTLALDIPMYDIPGGSAPFGTATPNGLYQKLQQLQAAGGTTAPNISIPLIGWAGGGNGPCQ